MKFILQRLYHTSGLKAGDYTCGFMENDDKTFRSFVLEDTYQSKKIHGMTRIWDGFYKLGLRKEATPLTIKHREAYAGMSWFRANPDWFHIEIMNIREFSGVYIHSGNDDAHTLGCLLPAYLFDISLTEKPTAKSLLAVNDFYAIAYPILLAGGEVHLEIRNEVGMT